MIRRAALFLGIAAISTAAPAEPLTIRVGESWAFSVKNGQPVRAYRIKPSARPGRGEIKASVSALAGTTMTLTNNSAISYTYRAQLVGVKAGGRTCTLPGGMKPTLEYWPRKAAGVRLSDFEATKESGSCPTPGG